MIIVFRNENKPFLESCRASISTCGRMKPRLTRIVLVRGYCPSLVSAFSPLSLYFNDRIVLFLHPRTFLRTCHMSWPSLAPYRFPKTPTGVFNRKLHWRVANPFPPTTSSQKRTNLPRIRQQVTCQDTYAGSQSAKFPHISHPNFPPCIVFFCQVQAVCIGIEHLVKAHKRRANGIDGGEPAVVCQLCESTRRVLRAAREHAKLVGHDKKNCDACRMWTMVRARYTYRQRVHAANARSAALNAAFESSKVSEGGGNCVDPSSGATQEMKEGYPMRVLEKKKRNVRFCNEVDYGMEEKRVRMVHTEGG